LIVFEGEEIMKNRFRQIMRGTVEMGQAGFTLMEMLIVIALIGMMATFVGINVMKRYDESKVATTKIQIKQIGVVLEDFKRVCNFYPTTEQGLDALVKKPEGRECKNYDPDGFLKKVPEDAWGHEFSYVSDGNKYIIKSLGADGQEGGEGFNKDISSDDAD
jgi:general secretion pathway protein G